MSILLLGGHERMERIYKQQGKDKGFNMKVMCKIRSGFTKRIGNPDAIIIFTNTVSHKTVLAAENMAKKNNLTVIKSHTSSQFALHNILNNF